MTLVTATPSFGCTVTRLTITQWMPNIFFPAMTRLASSYVPAAMWTVPVSDAASVSASLNALSSVFQG